MPRGFVRFVIHKLDLDSGRKQGLFHALADLSRAGKLDPSDSLDYQRVRDWFGEHLPQAGSPCAIDEASGQGRRPQLVQGRSRRAHSPDATTG